MPIFCALRQSFIPVKASQKLGVGCKLFGVGRKQVYDINPWALKKPAI